MLHKDDSGIRCKSEQHDLSKYETLCFHKIQCDSHTVETVVREKGRLTVDLPLLISFSPLMALSQPPDPAGIPCYPQATPAGRPGRLTTDLPVSIPSNTAPTPSHSQLCSRLSAVTSPHFLSFSQGTKQTLVWGTPCFSPSHGCPKHPLS